MNTCKEKFIKRLPQKYYPNLTDREEIQLFNHYHNGELNQFFLIVIRKVLEQKKFTCNNHDVILGLLAKYSKLDFSDIPMNCMDDVIRFVAFTYTRLMIIDIDEIDTRDF